MGAKAALAPGQVASSAAERIGTVTHYYEHVGAATVRLEHGALAVGDVIHVRGHTTDFYQPVERLERDHASVERAVAGEEVAVQVGQRVRENDAVHRLA